MAKSSETRSKPRTLRCRPVEFFELRGIPGHGCPSWASREPDQLVLTWANRIFQTPPRLGTPRVGLFRRKQGRQLHNNATCVGLVSTMWLVHKPRLLEAPRTACQNIQPGLAPGESNGRHLQGRLMGLQCRCRVFVGVCARSPFTWGRPVIYGPPQLIFLHLRLMGKRMRVKWD